LEIGALKIATNILGAAIQHSEIQDALRFSEENIDN